MRLSLALLIFAAAVSTCDAQLVRSSLEQPSRSEIENLLLSDDPREIAWGAHYAAASKDPAVAQDLLQAAEHWQPLAQPQSGDLAPVQLSEDQKDRRDAMAAVLDALIERNVQVPAETLGNLAADFQNYVAVLLSRLPLDESRDLSLELFRHPPFNGDTLQYVSAALLARKPTQGFAADLLSGIEVYARIEIVSPQTPEYGSQSTGCFGGEGIPGPREDWPLFGVYSLSREKRPGAWPLLTVPDPVYSVRSAVSNHYSGGGGSVPLLAEDRRRLIAFILGVQPETLTWKTRFSQEIIFVSEAQFEFELKNFVDELEEQYRSTAADLAAENLITASEEQDAWPSLALHWIDLRGVGYEPIPKPAFLPPKVNWIEEP